MDRMIARIRVWITLLKDCFSVSLASSTTVILRPGYCFSISRTFLVTWLETSIAVELCCFLIPREITSSPL